MSRLSGINTPSSDRADDRGAGETSLVSAQTSVPVRVARRWTRVLLGIGLAISLILLGAAADRLVGQIEAIPDPGAESIDVGFAQDMSVHHGNAVQMASWIRDHSTDPVIRQLAYDIESGQTAQIGQMQGWLSLWGAALQPVNGYMRWVPGMEQAHAAAGVAAMPGMASQDDLARLRASSGPSADVLFLQLMIRHHQGGAAMLDVAAQLAQQSQVRNLAAQMLTAQSAETVLMRQLLSERGATPLEK
ncbi:DUF305 domain-containing protein [Pseudonocardia sp. RS010]|uniref:DUF305 domain-containing protein n=1 Tax=Pseudonocardia sp. RS010 TaxID=3385979 RepID=UPI00399FF29E